jgi:hypothetical protein
MSFLIFVVSEAIRSGGTNLLFRIPRFFVQLFTGRRGNSPAETRQIDGRSKIHSTNMQPD